MITSAIPSLADRIRAFDRAMTVKDVAKLFSVEKGTIYKRARSGDIPSFRVGTSVRFDPKALADWHEKH